MAPGAVPRSQAACPAARMAPWLGLIVAAQAEVLFVADLAAVRISLSHEPVAQVAPGTTVVAWSSRGMTGNAVGPLVAGCTCGT